MLNDWQVESVLHLATGATREEILQLAEKMQELANHGATTKLLGKLVSPDTMAEVAGTLKKSII